MADPALPAWLLILLAIISGTGIAAVGGVVTTYLRNRQVADTEERSIALAEVEKAIPGLGVVIEQLRTQNAAQADELDRINARNQHLVGEVFNLEQRVADLERELAMAKGLT